MENFKLTDFPPEILEKFLPSFDAKTISQMKLVCRKFFHVFNQDRYYKSYLHYPEEDFECDLKFKSPAKGVEEVVKQLKNGECGKFEGYLRLQNAHLENLRCGRLDCFETVNVIDESQLGLHGFFEGRDAENGQWLVCHFFDQIILVNLSTKQKLNISNTDYHVDSVDFKHGIVLLAIDSRRKYSVYKLISEEGYSLIPNIKEYSLKQIRTSPWPDAVPGLLDPQKVIFCIGSPPSMLMSFYASNRERKNFTIHLLVLDVDTGRVTHACDFVEASTSLMVKDLVMPSPNIVHVRIVGNSHVFKSFKLFPSPEEGRGKVQCIRTVNILPDRFDNVRSLLNSRSLVWVHGTNGCVFKISGVAKRFDEKDLLTFSIPNHNRVVGFLFPDIVLTTKTLFDILLIAPTQTQVEVHGRRANGLGNPIFVWKIPISHFGLDEHFFRFVDQWTYPTRKVVLSRQGESNYTFKIHYF